MGDAVKPALHGRDHCPGGTDPVPCLGPNPWILIADGATTAATDTWMPVPFTVAVYDPALVTLGDIFDLDTTDVGDTGNDRYRIITKAKGVYRAELQTFWDQVTTPGVNNSGYAVQDLFHGDVPLGLIIGNEFSRASADWPKDAATESHEMVDNPFLQSNMTLFLNETNFAWDPYAKQTTGSSRGLSGVRLYVEAMRYSDVSTWTFDTI